jgi:hypothetical protein
VTGDIFKSADWAREAEEKKRARQWYSAVLPVPDGATIASMSIRIPVGGVFVGLGVDDAGVYARVMVDGDERKFYAGKP